MIVAKHEDLNAKNQIVTIGKPEEVKPTVLPTATPAAGSTPANPATNSSITTGNQNNPAQSTQNVATAPVKTGDTAAPFLWTALVLLSAMLVLAAWRKKYPK